MFYNTVDMIDKNFDNIKIQPACKAHAEMACSLITSSINNICLNDYAEHPDFIKDWLSNKTPENIRRWIEHDGNISYVAIDGDIVVGIIMASTDGYILLNYLLPIVLKMGIGTRLLDAIENHLILSNKIDKLKVDSTITAKNFYMQHGFFSSGEPILYNGTPVEFPLEKLLT